VKRDVVDINYRKAIWVYRKIKAGDTFSFLLENNQAFNTITIAAKALKVSDMTINKYLDTYTEHKGLYFLSKRVDNNLLLKEIEDKSKGYWVYKNINDQYSLLDNQPFKSK
jgi:hypothetical protein